MITHDIYNYSKYSQYIKLWNKTNGYFIDIFILVCKGHFVGKLVKRNCPYRKFKTMISKYIQISE